MHNRLISQGKALAAVTVAAASLFAATDVKAALVFREYNVSLDNGFFDVGGTSNKQFDFNLDGVNDFDFYHQTTKPGTGSPSNPGYDYNGKLALNSAKKTQFIAFVKDNDAGSTGSINSIENYVETLHPGFVIGGSGLSGFITASPGTTAYNDRLLDSTGTGNFGALSVGTGERNPLDRADDIAYIGFAFGDAANPNYGYIELTQIGNDDDPDGPPTTTHDRNAAVLTRIVYNTTAGTPVVVGSVPEPTTIAGLAGLGVFAFVRRRRA